jgi:hypothetical protein
MKNYTNIKNIKDDFFKQKDKFFKKSKEVVFNFYFTYKKFEIGIQYESDESVQYYILSIDGFNLPEGVIDELTETENIEHIDDYLYALENGDFDWVKEIYKDLNGFMEKHINRDVVNTDAKELIIKDFFRDYFEL